ncbi:MAG: class I fructose-bisphosphate aldolase [Bacteroidota bacterium]
MKYTDIESLLGAEATHLLTHQSTTIPREQLHLPGADVMQRVWVYANRNTQVLKSLTQLMGHGRLAHTGYVSILPVDQGIEHGAGAAFGPNPTYLDPANRVELAIEGGCNAIATTLGALAIVSRKYAHRIPCIAKINHNELLTYPNKYDQTMFGSVKAAWDLGATAVGATIYFGSAEAMRQLAAVSAAFEQAHEMGMATVLWCYLRNAAFQTPQADYHLAADATAQANYLGVTIQADLIKQKLPECNGAFTALQFGKVHPRMYDKLTSDHPIDLCRYQVAHGYMGRIGLINSGGAARGASDLAEAVRIAVINKRAGGMGLIAGRKAFQKPFQEGVQLLHAIQDVYLTPAITIA